MARAPSLFEDTFAVSEQEMLDMVEQEQQKLEDDPEPRESIDEACLIAAFICMEGYFLRSPPTGLRVRRKSFDMLMKCARKLSDAQFR